MSEQNTKTHNILDRYRVRRTVALLSLAMIVVMVGVWSYAVFNPDADISERLNEVSGFGGMLASACLTMVMGYTVSVHLDDQNVRSSQNGASYEAPPQSQHVDINLPMAPRQTGGVQDSTAPVARNREPVPLPATSTSRQRPRDGGAVADLLRRAEREGGRPHDHTG